MTPLPLPRIARAVARARGRLGGGRDYPFTLNGEQGVLRLRPAAAVSGRCGMPEAAAPLASGVRPGDISGGRDGQDAPVLSAAGVRPGDISGGRDGQDAPVFSGAGTRPGDMSGCRCEHGLLLLSAAGPALGLMADCPALPIAENNADPASCPGWYWSLYNQLLATELQALFGSLRAVPPQSVGDAVTLELTVTLGDRRARSLLCLSAGTLRRLLDISGWRRVQAPLPQDLALALPLTLGTLTLSLDDVGSLRPGDMLLPTGRCFSPAGEGRVRCGLLTLRGQLRPGADTMTHFYITTMENTDVTMNSDELDDDQPQASDAGEEWETGPLTDASAFAPLPLLLSVRCGQLKMTLGALQRLAPGALLLVENVLPGEAVLCHGEYALAKGELVDVEGQLGLEITQVFSACRDPLRGGA
ncbi:FliM/FliN family flagellar motor switch protein [Acerihabitans arboris]|uniref:Flagellar motor switch protein FliN-like C-terminal domain-containing protein n=1 Tax=Acerihabitans arboris TaxID=2691583 RepID=A0A845SK97_9GAMM|nr:FliM/FliN family flagellar motor switch protein [Acerihabitans arboris]NDL63384.1 hypothetical protein [Acerihabitans arboris]